VYAPTETHDIAARRCCRASLIEVAGCDCGISTDDDAEAVRVFVRAGPHSAPHRRTNDQ